MSYDVQLIQVPVPPKTSFPLDESGAKKLMKDRLKFDEPTVVRELLLKMDGCREGPDKSVDFVGRALSYARFVVKKDLIHVENNCGPKELLKIYGELLKQFPKLLILDLQSHQLHNAASFEQWWSRPL